MKRFLLWLVGVVLGVGIFLGAVMGVSYAFTTEGGCPDSTAQFGTEALEPNGWCWQVPLIGGKLDKVFASPATLTVQKLGTLYCWVSVKQFSKNDTATACQDWLRSTRLGRGSIKSHVRTVKVLGMGLFAFQERIHLWKGVTH